MGAMEWLNYHHLLYFWTVAKEGSVTRASRKLRLSHSTVSGQVHQLEEALGVQLFRRVGRGLELTDRGRTGSAEPPGGRERPVVHGHA